MLLAETHKQAAVQHQLHLCFHSETILNISWLSSLPKVEMKRPGPSHLCPWLRFCQRTLLYQLSLAASSH